MKHHILPFAIISAVVFVFCIPFFFPHLSLLITPDFGSSDSTSVSLSGKWILSEALQKNTLPFWSSKIGMGFPVFSEGQIGTLYPVNLLLFKLFPPVLAYTLALFSSLLLFGWGIYILGRIFNRSIYSSTIIGCVAPLSGIAIMQLTHISLLQGLSLLPWTIAFSLLAAQHSTKRRVALASCIVGMQLCTGNPQPAFLSGIFAFLFLIVDSGNKTRVRSIGLLSLVFILGAGIAAIQLIPSYYFLQLTTAPLGFEEWAATYFSYPIKHLVTFFDPYLLGNPRLGTYPSFETFSGSIFWENTGYIGILPLLGAIGIVVLLFTKKIKLTSTPKTLLLLFFLFTLCMFGKYSPLYFLFSFPPFSFFRVPSRFLWLTVLCLLLLSAHTFDWLLGGLEKKWKTLFCAGILLFSSINLLVVFGRYHLLVPASDYLSEPTLSTRIPNSQPIFTVGRFVPHNALFTASGWKNGNPYGEFRNFFSPNENVLFGKTQFGESAGRSRARQYLVNMALNPKITEDTPLATISGTTSDLMKNLGISFVVSGIPLDWEKTTEKVYEQEALFLYRIATDTAKIRLTTNVVQGTTAKSALAFLTDRTRTVIEDDIPVSSGSAVGTLTVVTDEEGRLAIHVSNNPHPSLLVIPKSYDPGWNARVNGKKGNILPVNILSMGLVVPQGNSDITFTYIPKGFFLGAGISFCTIIFLIGIFLTGPRPVHSLFRTDA